MLNRHLAREKRALDSLLADTNPKIVLRDGSLHSFKREELEELASLLPPEDHPKLMLPIYIELSPARYGKGTLRVTGRLECAVVSKVLNRDSTGDVFYVYKPELRVIRKRLPTTTQYMFTFAE